jgi:hypothetical protein
MNPGPKDGSHRSLAMAGIVAGLLLAMLGAGVGVYGNDLLPERVFDSVADHLDSWFPHSQVVRQMVDGYYNIIFRLHANLRDNNLMCAFWLEAAGALVVVLSIFTWMRKKDPDDEERLRP